MEHGHAYIIGALNALSCQPGLIDRLIKPSKLNSKGYYEVRLNINGQWESILIDDYLLFYKNSDGFTLPYNCSPYHLTNEIWHLILEKALIKRYGGYNFSLNGIENYTLRDLTGAPVTTKRINMITPGTTIGASEESLIADVYNKIDKRLKKGHIVTMVPRNPTQNEQELNKMRGDPPNRIGDGLFSGHSYAILSSAEFEGSDGQLHKVLKLRNPYHSQKWEGDWSYDSHLWTDQLLEQTHCSDSVDGDG